MTSMLKAGLRHRILYKVPESKIVPYTFPESPQIAAAKTANAGETRMVR